MTGKILTIYDQISGYDFEILMRPDKSVGLVELQVCEKEEGEEKFVWRMESEGAVYFARELLALAEEVANAQKPKLEKQPEMPKV